MSVQENKAVVRRWIEARNTDDVEAAVAQWTSDQQDRIHKAFDRFTAGFSGIQITVREMIAEGENGAYNLCYRNRQNGQKPGDGVDDLEVRYEREPNAFHSLHDQRQTNRSQPRRPSSTLPGLGRAQR